MQSNVKMVIGRSNGEDGMKKEKERRWQIEAPNNAQFAFDIYLSLSVSCVVSGPTFFQFQPAAPLVFT